MNIEFLGDIANMAGTLFGIVAVIGAYIGYRENKKKDKIARIEAERAALEAERARREQIEREDRARLEEERAKRREFLVEWITRSDRSMEARKEAYREYCELNGNGVIRREYARLLGGEEEGGE
jgi:hypothetical protein